MNEDFIPFELAVKLKEKGFNEPCYGYYHCNGGNDSFELCGDRDFLNSKNRYRVAAPTISQVLKWFREEKKLHIEPCILADSDTDADNKRINEYTYWSFSIVSIETGDMIYFEYEHIDDKRFDTFESAVLAGIEYVLDNLFYDTRNKV